MKSAFARGEGSVKSITSVRHRGRETKRTVASVVALLASALPLLYFGILARPAHDESSVAPVSPTPEEFPPGTNSRHPRESPA